MTIPNSARPLLGVSTCRTPYAVNKLIVNIMLCYMFYYSKSARQCIMMISFSFEARCISQIKTCPHEVCKKMLLDIQTIKYDMQALNLCAVHTNYSNNGSVAEVRDDPQPPRALKNYKRLNFVSIFSWHFRKDAAARFQQPVDIIF